MSEKYMSDIWVEYLTRVPPRQADDTHALADACRPTRPCLSNVVLIPSALIFNANRAAETC